MSHITDTTNMLETLSHVRRVYTSSGALGTTFLP